MLELYKNIRRRREYLGLSQEELAAKMGYASRSSINKIEMGKNDIPQSKIEAFAKALETTPSALMGWSDPKVIEPTRNPSISFNPKEEAIITKYRDCDPPGQQLVDDVLEYEYNRSLTVKGDRPTTETDVFMDNPTAAGFGNYLVDSPPVRMKFDSDVVPRGTDYGVRVVGNSMEPEIPDGSIIFVQSKPAVLNGQIGLFSLNGDAIVKRLDIDQSRRRIRLLSTNPDYAPREISVHDTLHTFGQVLGNAMTDKGEM